MRKPVLMCRLILQALRSNLRHEVRCPCGWTGKTFMPLHIGHPSYVRCPQKDCLSVDRQRLYFIFLLLNYRKIGKCLHVAPSMLIRRYLQQCSSEYLSIDLDPTHVMKKEDVTCLSFPDESFDFIFCAHVLEHVPDDQRAMSEFYRVLKKGGKAMLQVPMSTHEKTYEDFTITDPVARRKSFGQEDHVRRYGRDYFNRLMNAGFTVNVVHFYQLLPSFVRTAFGLRSEDIVICSKKID